MTNEVKSEQFSNKDIHQLLLGITKNLESSQIELNHNNLSILLPLKSASTTYVPIKSPQNDKIHSDDRKLLKGGSKMKKKFIDRLNVRIEKYNEFIDSQFEELKTGQQDKVFTSEQPFKKWALLLTFDKPTPSQEISRIELKQVITINNKFLFKRGLLISDKQFVLRFNKMVYDYITSIIPQSRGISAQHLFYRPIIEYENWFQKTGHFIQETPSLLDEIKEDKISENPLVTKSGVNQELSNAHKMILKQREKIKQLNNPAEMKVKEMIGKNILDSEVDKLRFKSSGRVNWWGLSKLLGCSDKKAKDLILRHAPYLHRDDEMGYLK